MSRPAANHSSPPKIEWVKVEDLLLDPKNPHLGRRNTEENLSQDKILEIMKDWTLDELAVSFIESSYWPQEAVIVVSEKLYGKEADVVVEGNRRLAALKLLHKAWKGEAISGKWDELAKSASKAQRAELDEIAIIRKPNRAAVKSYLGFRHVTGIAEWNPAEKAEFIASLIDVDKLTYDQVRKRIGSKTPTVRQNYIAYRVLLQMEEEGEDIDLKRVEDRFSVLYLSLRTNGVQQYLQIDINADPMAAVLSP